LSEAETAQNTLQMKEMHTSSVKQSDRMTFSPQYLVLFTILP